MKESAYKDKILKFKKQKKTAENRIVGLEKEIKEQQTIIKKAEGEMLNLSMEHAKIKVETLVDMIDKSTKVQDNAEEPISAHHIYGGISNED